MLDEFFIPDVPNLTNAVVQEEDAAFIAGAAAALMSKSRIIGFVGGWQFPGVEPFQAGMRPGLAISILTSLFCPDIWAQC